MSSNIVPENIDGSFPVAGIDNSSNGFRTNFTHIVTNFESAREEIDDLQKKVLLKSPLTGESGVDNDYADTVVRAPKIIDSSEVVKDHELVAGPVVLSHTEGHYHILQTTNDIILVFRDWPESAFGRIRVEINIANTDHTIELPAEVSIGANTLSGYDPLSYKVTFPSSPDVAPGIHILEFTSHDTGATVAVEDISRSPNDIMVRQVPSSKGVAGDKYGMTCSDGLYFYFCYHDYSDGDSNIWGRTQIDITPW